jgi:hypothetical protein
MKKINKQDWQDPPSAGKVNYSLNSYLAAEGDLAYLVIFLNIFILFTHSSARVAH